MQTITFTEPGYSSVLFFDAARFDGTEVELKVDNIDDRRNTYMLTSEFVAAARQILALPEVTQVKPSSPGKIEVFAFTRLSPETYAKILEILDAFCAPAGSRYPRFVHESADSSGKLVSTIQAPPPEYEMPTHPAVPPLSGSAEHGLSDFNGGFPAVEL